MSWQVFVDAETQTAILVDPAGPWALGPCLVGPSASDTLTAFVHGLDQDPAELTTWELATTWQQFLAIMGTVADDDRVSVVEVDQPAPAPLTDELEELARLGEPATREPAGEGTAVMEAGRDEPPAEQTAFPPCPNCKATRREVNPDGAIACAVCGERFE